MPTWRHEQNGEEDEQIQPGRDMADGGHDRSFERQLNYGNAEHDMSLRGLSTGLVFSIVVCVTNIYFALQTGWGTTMSLPSSLLAFVVARVLQPIFKDTFTPAENVLVSTVANNAGTVCMASGFVGIFPAMEYLMKPSEGAPDELTLSRLMLWTLGTSLTGGIFSVVLWKQLIVREDLPFPTGRANALLISTLHKSNAEPHKRQSDDFTSGTAETDELLQQTSPDGGIVNFEARAFESSFESADGQQDYSRLVAVALLLAAVFTFISYFVPQVRAIPVFGKNIASNWLWVLDPSPAYIGQGAILGTSIAIYVMVGALLGWVILSPMSSHLGWAPGPIGDVENGPKGWVLWISLSILVADSIVNIGWMLAHTCMQWASRKQQDNTDRPNSVEEQDRTSTLPLIQTRRQSQNSSQSDRDSTLSLKTSTIPPVASSTRTYAMLAIAVMFCALCVNITFGSYIGVVATLLAIGLGMMNATMGARTKAETDNLPNSALAKISQLVFGYIASAPDPKAIMINLIAGSISEASSHRTGSTMQDYKTAQLVGVSAKAQLYGSVIGGIFGAILTPLVYRLYTSAYHLPTGLFQIPSAYIWLFSARLLTGQGLPTMVPQMGALFGTVFMVLAALRNAMSRHPSAKVRGWHLFVPSGTAVAIGMYAPPSFAIPRLVGGLLNWWYLRRYPGRRTTVTMVASGLMIGEGVTSVLNLIMASLGVPHL